MTPEQRRAEKRTEQRKRVQQERRAADDDRRRLAEWIEENVPGTAVVRNPSGEWFVTPFRPENCSISQGIP